MLPDALKLYIYINYLWTCVDVIYKNIWTGCGIDGKVSISILQCEINLRVLTLCVVIIHIILAFPSTLLIYMKK